MRFLTIGALNTRVKGFSYLIIGSIWPPYGFFLDTEEMQYFRANLFFEKCDYPIASVTLSTSLTIFSRDFTRNVNFFYKMCFSFIAFQLAHPDSNSLRIKDCLSMGVQCICIYYWQYYLLFGWSKYVQFPWYKFSTRFTLHADYLIFF